ncbi:putative nuclease HARBI1 [Pecten maximus]|uniref:putative nuclease HARBI1 n=1 Tax=Pecten maximus TaxID=6579 RepID=UPI001458D22A|nr:putative nuclease HARBI1 [Pecten maximus]
MFLTQLLREDLERKSRRNNALTIQQQVLSTLRFLASLDKSTVSRCVHTVCGKLACYVSQVVKRPTAEECQKGKGTFFAGFPSVIGAVDGTHIRIQAPHQDEPSYVNRKGYHSINVQGVCDADVKQPLDVLALVAENRRLDKEGACQTCIKQRTFKEEIVRNMPSKYKEEIPDTIVIINGTELKIQKLSALNRQSVLLGL